MDTDKILHDMVDEFSSDCQYLGIYMFIVYKNHLKFKFLPKDVLYFIERAFDSNNIDFDKLEFMYSLIKDYVNFDDE